MLSSEILKQVLMVYFVVSVITLLLQSWDVGRGATFFGPALAADSVFGVSSNPLGYPKIDQWKSPIGTQGFQFVRGGSFLRIS